MLFVLDIGGIFTKYALMKEDGMILQRGKNPTNRKFFKASLLGAH